PFIDAVIAELQQDRRMVGGSPCLLRIDPAKIERTEIKRVDKHVNYTNRVVLVDPIIQTFGKQRRLPAIHPLDKALHRDLPPKIASQSYHRGLFLHSLGREPSSEPGVKGHIDLPAAKARADQPVRRPRPGA